MAGPKESKSGRAAPSLAGKKSEVSAQKFLFFDGIINGIVILKDKSLRQIVMVSSINFALMSEQEQDMKVAAFQEFLNSLEFPIQIVVQSRKFDIRGYIEKVKEAARQQNNQLLKGQMQEYAEFIKFLVEEVNITTNHYYVVVPYFGGPLQKGEKQGFLTGLKNKISPAKQIKAEQFGFKEGKEKIKLRSNLITSGLGSIGLNATLLNTQETVELLYSWYNPDTSAEQVLADLDKLQVEKVK